MKPVTLRDARERKKWTQEQLEAESGVSQSVISRLETDANANPTLAVITKLEAALGVPRGSLVFGPSVEQEA